MVDQRGVEPLSYAQTITILFTALHGLSSSPGLAVQPQRYKPQFI